MSETPPLWYEFRNALYGGDFEVAEELLKATPALIHIASSLGETALHFLAVEDDQASVSWLCARGADLNTRNIFGTPVVFEVAQLEYKELFSWFVEHGVDLRVRNSDDQDLVEYLLEHDKEEMAEWVRKNGA
jgi:ankyrin repeat protein